MIDLTAIYGLFTYGQGGYSGGFMTFADDVKEYCGTDDDVSAYIAAAEAYLLNAGVTKDEDNLLYVLAVKMLVSFWYDNRTPEPGEKGDNVPQPYGLNGIILQLQLSQGV